MRYLGIDFGHKKMGLALSDEQGNFAYPHSVILTDGESIKKIINLCASEKVGAMVIGDTKDLSGGKNTVTEALEKFVAELKKSIDLPIFFQTEVFSSREAERVIGDDEMRDARAAAIILESFLATKRN
jgi:putative Holliday junction resolvase